MTRPGVARIAAAIKPHRGPACDLVWDGMVSVLPLPDWVPLWVHAAILGAAGLLALCFLLMPFAVFGTKARLAAIEARLDEIQGEIRSLSLRLPEPLTDMRDDDVEYGVDRYSGRPPIPPAPRDTAGPIQRPPAAASPAARRPPARPDRTEPRLY